MPVDDQSLLPHKASECPHPVIPPWDGAAKKRSG